MRSDSGCWIYIILDLLCDAIFGDFSSSTPQSTATSHSALRRCVRGEGSSAVLGKCAERARNGPRGCGRPRIAAPPPP